MNSIEFRFIFADREDIFFSNHMLRLDFEQYLYLEMKREGFQYIYHFHVINEECIQVCCEKYEELKKYCEKTKKGLFKKSIEIKDKKTVKLHSGSKRSVYGVEQSPKMVCENIEDLLSDACVFVFSMSSFHDIFSREEIQKLDRLLSKNRFNNQKAMFLFVENEAYAGQLPYLPESVLSEKVVQEINHDITKDNFFERLKSHNLNCEKWEAFGSTQIQIMVHRAFLSFSEIVDGETIKQMADFLYCYLVKSRNQRLFEIKVNNQRDLFQKILLDKEYLKQLKKKCMNDNY